MKFKRTSNSTPSWLLDRPRPNVNICPPEWLPIRLTGTVPAGSAGSNPSIPIVSPPAPPNPQSAAPDAPPNIPEVAPPPTAERTDPQRPPRKRRPKPAASAASEALGRAQSSVPTKPDPDFHRRRCVVCNHEDRADIEAAFLSWQPIDRIVKDYNLNDRCTIYRHANATDLFEQRRQHMRRALDLIIEQAGSVKVSAADVIRAVELSLRIDGKDVAPLNRYEITYIGEKPGKKGEEKANRDTSQLTPPLTH